MKRILFLPLVLLAFLFTGCMNENEDYEQEYLELGVVHGYSSTNFLIKTDSDLILYPVESLANLDVENGERVLVRYTVVEQAQGLDYDFAIKVLALAEIETSEIVHADSQEVRDTLKNDPVQIINVWIAQHFLNIEFTFSGSQKDHYFYVAKDPENQLEEGTPIVLDFHHNANEDVNYSTYRTVISVPIWELQNMSATSVDIRFVSRDEYSTPYTRDLEYKYVEEEE